MNARIKKAHWIHRHQPLQYELIVNLKTAKTISLERRVLVWCATRREMAGCINVALQ
jgi:hypothetical protein